MSAASKRRSAREQTTLEFPHNALAANLAGAHQKNFVRLEQKTVVILDIERLKRKSGSSG